MKGLLGLSAFIAFLVAVPVTHFVWGKGHVPVDQVQVCHKGKVIQVGAPALGGHVGHGDSRLPTCDFNNVFHAGEDCSGVSDGDGDGLADAGLNPPSSSCGVTPGCPAEGFQHPQHPVACF